MNWLKRFSPILISIIFILVACQTDSPPDPTSESQESPTMTPEIDTQSAPMTAELDKPFTLAVSEGKTVNGTELTVTFEMVERDGRCPSAVLCAENGPVVVIISAVLGDEQPTTFTMNPDPQLAQLSGVPPNIMDFQGYQIELTAVEPYPEQPEDLMNLPYTATFIISQTN